MPAVLEKHVKGMEKSGMPKDQAYAIATSNLQKKGVLKPGTNQLAKKSAYKRKMDSM